MITIEVIPYTGIDNSNPVYGNRGVKRKEVEVMVNQSKMVKRIKGRIQSLLNLINLGLRKYALVLLDLEQKLVEALSSQLNPITWTLQGGKRQAKVWLAKINGLDAKYGFSRDFIPATSIEWGKKGMNSAKFTISEPGYYHDSDGDYVRVLVDGDGLDAEVCSYLEVAAHFGRVKV